MSSWKPVSIVHPISELPLVSDLPRDKNNLEISGNFVAIQNLETFKRVYLDFKSSSSDVFISSYPKSGTTWTIAIVDQIKKNFDEDYKIPQGIASGFQRSSVPWIETLALDKDSNEWKKSLDFFETIKEPRVFKTHSCIGMIPSDKPKLIQVVRNPLDTFVSAWHHSCSKGKYRGSFDRFFERVVLNGLFQSGCWFEYHAEIFEYCSKNCENTKLIFYEHMLKNGSVSEVKRITEFLGFDSEKIDVLNISERCNFQNMKKINNDHGFVNDLIKEKGNQVWSDESEGSKVKFSNAHIRKGVVGDWVNYYSNDQLKLWRDLVDKKLKKYPILLKFLTVGYIKGWYIKGT